LICAAGGEQPGYMAACVGAKRTASWSAAAAATRH